MCRPWLWWWRLPFAVAFAIIAWSLPDDPHAFTSPLFDHAGFAVASVLMAVASFTDGRQYVLRVAAMGASCLACGGRALVVLFSSSELTARQIITGMTTWCLLAGSIVLLTVISDRLRQLGG